MRVVVTGASGWVDSAVASQPIGAAHEVFGLARSEVSAQRLEAAGATVQRDLACSRGSTGCSRPRRGQLDRERVSRQNLAVGSEND
jgi:nucleoside-diphosphate-sugar epimerase